MHLFIWAFGVSHSGVQHGCYLCHIGAMVTFSLRTAFCMLTLTETADLRVLTLVLGYIVIYIAYIIALTTLDLGVV
jgi:hypothetical protein